MSGEVPEGWRSAELREIAGRITKGTTPTSIGFEFSSEGIPFIKIENIAPSGSLILDKASFISPECHSALARSIITKGTILFSIAGTLGRVCVYDLDFPANTNQAVALVSAISQDVDLGYLSLFLQSSEISSLIEKLKTVGAQPNISLKQLGDLVVPLPPLPEQQRIAEILSSVDESIRATEGVIVQAERVKQCMVDQFAIGKSHFEPESWAKISDVATINPRTSLVRGRVYPFIEMANLPIGSPEILKIEEREFSSGGAKFEVGDTLFARITPCTENGKLGFVRTLPTGGVAFGSTEFIVLRPKDAKVRPKLIYYYCFSNHVRQKAIQKMIGSTGRQRVPNHVFDEIQIPVYSLESQMAFEAAFGALDVQITTNRATVEQLQRLKRGLMDDLLTGRVRTIA